MTIDVIKLRGCLSEVDPKMRDTYILRLFHILTGLVERFGYGMQIRYSCIKSLGHGPLMTKRKCDDIWIRLGRIKVDEGLPSKANILLHCLQKTSRLVEPPTYHHIHQPATQSPSPPDPVPHLMPHSSGFLATTAKHSPQNFSNLHPYTFLSLAFPPKLL